MSAPVRSDRGFLHWPPVETTYGHEVRVYESSAVETSSSDGPFMWLAIEQTAAGTKRSGVAAGEMNAHLTLEQVQSVLGLLIQWLRLHGGLGTLPDEPIELDVVRTSLAAWIEAGAQPWEMPANAAHFALACNGAEAVRAGTQKALDACTEECAECGGDGHHQDDSHPGNPTHTCERCKGHGRVPRGTQGDEADEIVDDARALFVRLPFGGVRRYDDASEDVQQRYLDAVRELRGTR